MALTWAGFVSKALVPKNMDDMGSFRLLAQQSSSITSDTLMLKKANVAVVNVRDANIHRASSMGGVAETAWTPNTMTATPAPNNSLA